LLRKQRKTLGGVLFAAPCTCTQQLCITRIRGNSKRLRLQCQRSHHHKLCPRHRFVEPLGVLVAPHHFQTDDTLSSNVTHENICVRSKGSERVAVPIATLCVKKHFVSPLTYSGSLTSYYFGSKENN